MPSTSPSSPRIEPPSSHTTWFVGVAALLLVSSCGSPDTGTTPTPPEPSPRWLVDITKEVGLEFRYDTGARGEMHMPEIMGSGVALFDYDDDGDLDLYATNGNGSLPGTETDPASSNRLFGQQSDGRFVDVTASSGLGDGGYGMGVAIGDFDNDGRPDVYASNFGPDRLYRNRGDGTFEDVTRAAGIDVPGWSSSTTFCDYDLDGFLDLYVTQYVRYLPGKKCYSGTGEPEYCGPKEFSPVSDVLLHNEGDGTFQDVSESAGIHEVRAAGLGVVCDDLDQNGWPDFYVANDAYPNQLWSGDGSGRFRDEALFLGVAFNQHGQSEAGMGVIAEDLDSDGSLDLFITHLEVESNTLYRNLGTGSGFVDDSGRSGLGQTSMPYTGFGVAALDIELDGDLDLVVGNGRVTRGPLAPGGPPAPWAYFAEINLFYLNDGTGKFTLAGPELDEFRAAPEISRGLATGDIDRDGDLDLVVSNIEDPLRVYRNDAPRGGHWLAVRPVDPRRNRRLALGAQVRLVSGSSAILRVIRRGSSYQSSSDAVAHFGFSSDEAARSLEVRWPDGLQERFTLPGVDREIELVRGTGEAMAE